MSLLSLQGVAVSFGAEDILDGISAEVSAGDRIGLVGQNGVGKTTLLRVLAGQMRPLAGARHISQNVRCTLVEQLPPQSKEATTVRLEALSALSETLDLHTALEDAAHAMAAGDAAAAETYAGLLQRLEDEGGFSYEARLRQVLNGLGFKDADWDQPVSTLSGGQRSRLALAKALLSQPDLLLMDEPTNHLDIDGLRWLEGFLGRWPGTLIVTSHDRYFLDKLPTRIWLLEPSGMTSYPGNYSKFEELHAAARELQQKRYESQQAFIEKESEFIRRYGAGQRAGEAKGRERRLKRLLGTEHNSARHEPKALLINAPAKSKSAAFRFRGARGGDLVLNTTGLTAGYGETAILGVPDLEVRRGDRIALVGPNGAGKSTLLKTIAGQLTPVQGRLKLGSAIAMGHYWQEAEDLNLGASVLEEVMRDSDMTFQQARDLLGRFLFSGDDVTKPVRALSGGERSRLALARLVRSEANLLLLDEPTNHLDILSREALEAALDTYPGTLLFASHDRRLIARLATSLWLIGEGKLVAFDGGLEEYEAGRLAREQAEEAAKKPAAGRPSSAARGSEWKRQAAVAALERRIAEQEALLAATEEQIHAASEKADVAALAELGRRYDEVKSGLDAALEEWTQLQV